MNRTIETRKLKNHEQANCYVTIEETEHKTLIKFISYTTLVIKAEFANGLLEWEIKCHGTYSQTTRKQIGYFLKEYFPTLNYYDIKGIAGKDLRLYLDKHKNIIEVC